jgi:hypothetical protein
MPYRHSRVFLRYLSIVILLALLAGMAPPAIADSSASQEGRSSAAFAQISFVPNIETAGVVVSGSSLPKQAQLTYRRAGELNWRTGHPVMRIDDGRLIGSLFDLSPSTSYEVKVSDGATEIVGMVTTQPDELSFVPSSVIYVDSNALPGGDGSSAAPLRSIQDAVNRAGPGTQVLVADGVYREEITFPASGTAGNWIQVKAQGGGAILDSSEPLAADVWKPHESKARVWFTKIGPSIRYLARGQKRFYLYNDLNSLLDGRGHNGTSVNEGWYYEQGTSRLFVRNLEDPAKYSWQVPRLTNAFTVEGRDWIWIEGFEIRHYGASSGCGVCARNASHLVIRKNRIHNVQKGIFVDWSGGEDRGNDTRIEYNELYDPTTSDWPWKAVKGSTMEGTAIILRGHIGAIVRGNTIHDFFNGIYTGSSGALDNPAVAFDADIYNNRIYAIKDDAIEPEGTCVNHRFRNNTIDSTLVGVSIAPVTYGPVWVMRSTISNFTGTSFKWDLNSDGIVLIYHNTSWTRVSGLNAMSMLRPTYNTVMRNNIFQGTAYAFEEKFSGSARNDWNYNNWYTTRASPHFKWENVNYAAITDLCRGTGLECNGHESPPMLDANLALLAGSPNIDRGLLIPGINDVFYGSAPDIGAFESAFGAPPPATDTPPPITPTDTPPVIPTDTPMPTVTPVMDTAPPFVTSSLRADPSPTSADTVRFTVGFSEPVLGVDLADFVLTTNGLTEAALVDVTGTSSLYLVTVKTGKGSGSIRLDVIDNDSIVDASGLPLGGLGIGNGNFATGDMYVLDRSTPAVQTAVFFSNGGKDGWVLEGKETSDQGGSMNSISQTFKLGDDGKDLQYRAILDFSTASLPDNAVVSKAILMIQSQSVAGTNPFTTHRYMWIDIRQGAFGSFGPFAIGALQVSDFQAPASAYGVGTIQNNPVGNWYWSTLDAKAFPFINLKGSTQFRLGFLLDDNDDMSEDTISFYSGNFSGMIDRPTLLVEYYILK